ncbi:MAG: ABC transporter ATP-binding protein [Acidimicrobiia bacterium]
MSASAIVTEGLGKRFGSTWALRDCTLDIPTGSVCGLVGGNGAGKTTLLRLLAGLSTPSEGRAEVEGRRPADDAGFLAAMGFLAQDVPLYRRWTVADHLRLGAHLNSRWDDAAARDRLTGLEIPLDRRVGALSGGMRAQVALALALAKRPQVLLLDEPLASLDPFARHEFMSSLALAVADHGLTVVLSSHLLPDIERVSDHLVLLDRSRVVLCDSIERIVAAHRQISVPAGDERALDRSQQVVTSVRAEREVSALCRVTAPVLDPTWTVHAVGLEEIVLACLGRSAGAAPRPVELVR